MLFCCGALWAVTAATPLCGQIRIVPRAKLDSLAHPATAAGAEAMRFERTQIDAGHIGEDDTPPSYTFKWHNAGTAPLVITRVQTTCGCAAATYGRQPVRAGSEGTVTVTYHPKGHPGSFDRRIFVYTQLSDKMPTAILHLTGTVIASELTDGDYPYAMGALRLKQQSVRLAPERLQSERIECLNTGGKAMRPRCDEHLLPPGITFRCEPATLAPGAKGDLVIGFDPAQATRRPPVQLPLILEGPDVPPSGRTLQIRFEETEKETDKNESYENNF